MDPTASYLKALASALAKGNATEHTHRPALKAFIESLAPGITAINEPRRIACGAPDYIITKGEVPLGYVEAKDLGEPLDKVEKSEQMARYKGSLGNLILTDYLEFRWYAQGEKRLTARLGEVDSRGKITGDEAGTEAVLQLLDAFLKSQTPPLKSPKDLASRMAALARMIHDIIKLAFMSEEGGGTLHAQLKGFQEVLLHDLDSDQFADMYAQTICDGLFAARCAKPDDKPFTRMKAPFLLPKTDPFPVKGTNEVEKVRYEPGAEGSRVWINGLQHFADVPGAVWAFHMGGYQVCEKWLKDRKGRVLAHDDLRHYCRVVGALGDTIRLMGEVDEAIQAAGGWPLT